MHVEWNKIQETGKLQSTNDTVQSAKLDENSFSKCQNCTLEEIALLRTVQHNPTVTQKEIAKQISQNELLRELQSIYKKKEYFVGRTASEMDIGK